MDQNFCLLATMAGHHFHGITFSSSFDIYVYVSVHGKEYGMKESYQE
jgi:hypothetical protein